MFSSSIPPLLHCDCDTGLRPYWRMVLVDRTDADFPVAGFQGPELKTAFDLMRHPDLVAIDEEMHVIHLGGRLHLIFELIGALCLEFCAVGGGEDACETVFGRCRQDKEGRTGARESDRGDKCAGAGDGCLVGHDESSI